MPRALLREHRQRLIVDQIRSSGAADVTSLSRKFAASDMTIRRDLAELEADGLVRRVHGGAVTRDARVPFRQRVVTLGAEKAAIARRAAALVEDGDSVFVDMGTTAFAVAQELAERKGLFAVTYSISAARELGRTGENTVVLAGGIVHGDFEESTVVGEVACETIRRFKVDKAIFGAGGITPQRGISFFDMAEVQVRTAVLAAAGTAIVVADHTKFGRDDRVTFVPLERIDVIVTDAAPPKPFAAQARRHGVRMVVAR